MNLLGVDVFDEEQEQVWSLARDFAASELRPRGEHWDRDAAYDPAVRSQLAELGFFGLLVPEEAGGMGFGLPVLAAALEALAWGEPALAFTVAAQAQAADALARGGSPAARDRWLAALAVGEAVAGMALAEPGDGGAVLTAARNGNGGVALEGTVNWMTDAGVAHLLVVRTSTLGADLIVPADAPGVEVGEREATMGLRPLVLAPVRFSGVNVEANSATGSEGEDQSARGAVVSWISAAAVSVGIAQAALEHALGYTTEREQFGTRLRDFEGTQFTVAEMASRLSASRALLLRAAASPGVGAAAMAKLVASEAAMWITNRAVQLYGGYGYMRDYPVEKLMRDARAMEIVTGSSGSLRPLVARQLYPS